MNYTDLVTIIQDIAEDSFTTAQVNHFIAQAEQKIYHTVQFPDMRKSCLATLTADDPYLEVPTGFLWPLSLAVIDTNGDYQYLLNKDVNFIREAYPNPTTTALPEHYGMFADSHFILGPTPDATYTVELHYGFHPESIVTATNTWLGDNFDSALLNGALIEALRFIKGEGDMIAMYDKLYLQAITLLKQLGDGKMRQDSYRSGQFRQNVS